METIKPNFDICKSCKRFMNFYNNDGTIQFICYDEKLSIIGDSPYIDLVLYRGKYEASIPEDCNFYLEQVLSQKGD